MRLYQVITPSLYPDQGNMVTWHGTKADVAKRVAEIRGKCCRPHMPVERQEHDIPTDKAGLIDWLNENLSSR
jgi:hypothetical protein